MITIVTGLPRSGTSLMMQMLRAGGMPLLADDVRQPDEDNPEGYFELQRVKRTRTDAAWLVEAEGKAVKMVYLLLYDLPLDRRYQLIFMQRDLREVIASQNAMLARLGKPPARLSDAEMAAAFRDDLDKVKDWLARQTAFELLDVAYAELVRDPAAQAARVRNFLDLPLDAARMGAAVNPALYRQRTP